MQFLENISLRSFNTFGVDAKARYFTECPGEESLKEILEALKPMVLPVLVLGGGSNILFTRDFHGVVIKMMNKGLSVISNENDQILLEAGAGEVWDDLVAYTVDKGWSGLENLSLIPGTVGASPIQNIGAYGVEMKDAFHSLKAMDMTTGETRNFTHAECKFGYRSSAFKHELRGRFMILSVVFCLYRNKTPVISYDALRKALEDRSITNPGIRDIREVVCEIRRRKLPDPEVTGNAGSFFKNPSVTPLLYEELRKSFPSMVAYPDQGQWKLAAGWLIEQCGWKGRQIGKAGVHKDQALVIVNHGGATGKEILELSEKVQVSVFEKFGIMLEREINVY